MPRPIQAIIDLSAFEHNIEVVRQSVRADQSKIWAAIKANAYGHGIEHLFPVFENIDGLAVLDLQEAQKLRQLGWQKPILLLEGCFEVADYQMADQLKLATVIHSQYQADDLLKYLERRQSWPHTIYFKINTGMNRLGLSLESAYTTIQQLQQVLPRDLGLMTHFANSDLEGGSICSVNDQMSRFQHEVKRIEQNWPQFDFNLSCANSGAILEYPQTHLDWVRPGVMLYGASPNPTIKSAEAHGLKPVMHLNSQIIAIQKLKQNDVVGYGSHFRAEHDTTIGVIACGYADGYPRVIKNNTPVMVKGIRTQIVGRVSMDMITVDLSAIEHAKVGDQVQLWGDQLSVDEVAACAGTIGYELLTHLTARVPVKVQGL